MDTKTQIIEIARKLFAELGFDGVSVRTICAQANCNVSAISYYFGSKEELFHATMVEGAERRIKSIQGVLTTPENVDDFKTKLRIFLHQFFENSCDNSCTIRIIARDNKLIAENESVRAYFKIIPDIVAKFFGEAQERGILKKDFDPQILVDLTFSPYFMKILFADTKLGTPIDQDTRQRMVDQHIEIFCNGYLV